MNRRQPEDTSAQGQKSVSAEARRREQLLAIHSTELEEAPSMGEALLHVLITSMEACWICAILLGLASLNFLSVSYTSLMPLWAPFLFLVGAQWLFSLLERREAAQAGASAVTHEKTALPGTPFFITFICVSILLTIWSGIYAQNMSLYDPRWSGLMLNDILLLNASALHILFIVVLALYMCWRGIRLSYRSHEPSHVFNTLRIGMGIILAVVVIRAGQINTSKTSTDEIALLLLIPIFLFFSLTAHALARISFIRRTHPGGLEGNIEAQERSVISIIAASGLIILLLALLVDSFASPVIATGAQQVFAVLSVGYTWVVSILAGLMVILITPAFWLISFLGTFLHFNMPSVRQPRPATCQPTRAVPHPQCQPPSYVPTGVNTVLIGVLQYGIPIVLGIVILFLLFAVLRRHRRIRIVQTRRFEEIHESLWSWPLLWLQVKGLFLAFWRRLFPQAVQEEMQLDDAGEHAQALEVRSIREIYRAFLKLAANRGYPRRKDETPYEFRERLNTKTPLADSHLAVVTEVYNATRYGGHVPDEEELGRIRGEWKGLEQKWS